MHGDHHLFFLELKYRIPEKTRYTSITKAVSDTFVESPKQYPTINPKFKQIMKASKIKNLNGSFNVSYQT